jgi:hypothetical protein
MACTILSLDMARRLKYPTDTICFRTVDEEVRCMYLSVVYG